VSPARRRRAVEHLQRVFGVSQRWACQLVGQHRSTQRHRPVEPDRDRALRAELRQFSRTHPRWGYRRAHVQLVGQGWTINRKAIQRLWREEGLRVPARRRKRQRLGTSTCPADRLGAEHPNHVWALDYQFDQTTDGRILKLLNVVDEYTRRRWRSPSSGGSMPTPPSLSWTVWSPSEAGHRGSSAATTGRS
jgi:putative transposase